MAGKIESKIFIQGTLETLTGLHIGGNSVGLSIGGVDKVVVRNPISNIPYIPGSSIRGKMRSLLERVRGNEKEKEDKNSKEGGFSVVTKQDKVSYLAGKQANSLLGMLFGVAAEDHAQGPTRLVVRDACLTKHSHDRLKNAPNTDMPMTEVKTEVWVDRITSAANPRQIERIPAGCEFHFEFVVTLLTDDKKEDFLNLLFEGFRLLEADTLGGNGSRGYGQIRFHVEQILERSVEDYRESNEQKPLKCLAIPADFTNRQPPAGVR